MTYREICEAFTKSGIESAEWDALLLIEHFCKVSAAEVRTTPDKSYTAPALLSAVEQRLTRRPLQYILGSWQFYRQTYTVNEHCLVPRSDTEILVEEAIRRLPQNARFADLCTGSGCIAVSVLAERPDTTALAVEKFSETLSLAKKNALQNGVGERFTPLLGDVLTKDVYQALPPLDAILSNPPYIATRELSALSAEVQAEPVAALDGGEDGLLFYRAILAHATPLLSDCGFLLFEIGYDQGEAVCRLGRESGFEETGIIKDLSGNDRVVALSHLHRSLQRKDKDH